MALRTKDKNFGNGAKDTVYHENYENFDVLNIKTVLSS